MWGGGSRSAHMCLSGAAASEESECDINMHLSTATSAHMHFSVATTVEHLSTDAQSRCLHASESYACRPHTLLSHTSVASLGGSMLGEEREGAREGGGGGGREREREKRFKNAEGPPGELGGGGHSRCGQWSRLQQLAGGLLPLKLGLCVWVCEGVRV